MTRADYLALADSVTEQLEAWLALPKDERPEPVPESLLREALQSVREMREEVAGHHQVGKGRRGRGLTRSIIDVFDFRNWLRASGIVDDAMRLEAEYDRVEG